MVRKTIVIFCDNEHGTGDITFPDLDEGDTFAVKQMFVAPKRISELRKESKKQGWRRVNGADYCPSCMEAL